MGKLCRQFLLLRLYGIVYCFDRPDRSFECHTFARGRCGHSNFASVLHEVLWSVKNPFTMLHSPVHLHFFVPQPASNCTMAVLLVMLPPQRRVSENWLSPVTELHQAQAAVLLQVQAAAECEQTITSSPRAWCSHNSRDKEQLDHIIHPRVTKRNAD